MSAYACVGVALRISGVAVSISCLLEQPRWERCQVCLMRGQRVGGLEGATSDFG